MTKRLKLISILGLISVLIGLGLWRMVAAQGQGGKKDERALTVAVKRGDLELTLNETGRIEALRQVKIKSKISGIVSEVFVKDGDAVSFGKPLFRLEGSDYQRMVAQARASVMAADAHVSEVRKGYLPEEIKEAQATLEQAQLRLKFLKAEHVRNQQVDPRGIARAELAKSASEVELAQAELKLAQIRLQKLRRGSRPETIRSAQANLEKERIALQSAQDQLHYTTIYSPLDGVVIARGIEPGETVSPGVSATAESPTLMTIADLSRLIVKTSLNQIDIGKVKLKQSVQITVDAYPGKAFHGYVSKIAPAAMEGEKGIFYFPIEVTIDSVKDTQLLKPGMSANMDVLVEKKRNVLFLPIESVRLKGPKASVTYMQNVEPQKQEKKAKDIKIGLTTSRFVEVLDGLKEKDEVLINPPSGEDNTFKM